MEEFIQVLRKVRGEADQREQFNLLLRWITGVVPADGAAFIDLRKNADRPAILAVQGSLSRSRETGSLIVENGGSIPSSPSPVTISFEGSSNREQAFFFPVWVDDGVSASGILLYGGGASSASTRANGELFLVSVLLHDLLERASLREQLEREKAFISLLVDRKISSENGAVNPGFDLITEGLDLPLYMSNTSGAIIYASPAFLRLVGYNSVGEIRQRADFYLEPQNRIAELNLLKANGKLTSYSLGIRSGNGRRLEIQDSAVTVGAFVFGIFFDVTGFLDANKELKDALEIQELLNDRIIAAAQVLQRTQATSIRALARLAEYRDQETGFHLQRICEYTRIIAQQVYEQKPYSFHLTATYPNDISLSSMLHDIGKVSIPDSILLKPGRLVGDEWEVMKKHTTSGWDILHHADKELGEQSFLTLASTIALSHHEKYDGTGYPSGLRGERIPLSARISALADVYDALTTRRPYKEAWSHEKAVGEIRGLSQTHFDPVLVDIFSSVSDEFDGIRRVFPG